MPRRKLSGTSGVTLIEVTVAVAIFAVVIAVSAQTIISTYVGISVQKDRVAAMNSCRTILNACREKRGEYRAAEENSMVNWTNYFTWINTQNTANWSTYLTEVDGTAALKSHTMNVQLRNMTGGAATTADNPIEVHVVATWRDAKNRTMTARLVSRMSDR